MDNNWIIENIQETMRKYQQMASTWPQVNDETQRAILQLLEASAELGGQHRGLVTHLMALEVIISHVFVMDANGKYHVNPGALTLLESGEHAENGYEVGDEPEPS